MKLSQQLKDRTGVLVSEYPDGGDPCVLIIRIEGIPNPADLGAHLTRAILTVLGPN